MQQVKKLPSISRLTNRGVINLDTDGSRYHQLQIRLTNSGTTGSLQGVADVIDELRIRINSRIVRRIRGNQIEALVDFNGVGFSTFTVDNDTYLTIYFAEPWRNTPNAVEALAWGTGNVSSAQIEFDYNSSASNVFMEGKAFVDYPVFESGPRAGQYLDIGQIIQVGQHEIGANGAGRITFTDLPLNMPYLRLHAFSQYVDSISVRNGGAVLVDELTKEENNAQQTKLGFNPRSDVFTLAFDRTQLINDAMPVDPSKQLRIDFEMLTGAQPFTLVYEQLGVPGQ